MNFMNCINAVLFDLDGVILDTESMYMKAMLEFNDRYKINISTNYYISNFLGKTKKQIIDIFLKKSILKKDLLEKYWSELLKYREDYINKNKINIKKGFFDLVNYLKKNNVVIGIVTSNSLQFVKKLLIKAEIDIDIFDLIITRDDVNITKPSPNLYLYALKKLNINKDNVFAIEDSNIGIMAAYSAGVKVINVTDIDNITKTNIKKCFTTVQSLNNVIDIFQEKRE